MEDASTELGSHPFWLESDDSHPSIPVVDLPELTDVVVIGGGITGVSVCYWLMKYGITNVALLEQRHALCQGATGRNGGHSWPFPIARRTSSVEDMVLSNEFKLNNFQLMHQFILDNNVDCDFEPKGAVDMYCDDDQEEDAKEDMEFWQKNGVNHFNFSWWDKEKCEQEFKCMNIKSAGLRQEIAASLWPPKLVYAITNKILESDMPCSFHFNTKVEKIEEKDDEEYRYIVHTQNSGKIQTKVVIHATNAWLDELLRGRDLACYTNYSKSQDSEESSEDENDEGKDNLVVPIRGQVLSTTPIHSSLLPVPLPNLAFDDDAQYLIHRKDGRIVVGGKRYASKTKERYTLDDSVIHPLVSEQLHQFLQDTFSNLVESQSPSPVLPSEAEKGFFKVEKEWTGIMGFSKDRNPLIGPLKTYSTTLHDGKTEIDGGEYISAGYTGNGMAHAFQAGKYLAELISKNLPPDQVVKVFLPTRFF